jgi:hypothetical protein
MTLVCKKNFVKTGWSDSFPGGKDTVSKAIIIPDYIQFSQFQIFGAVALVFFEVNAVICYMHQM